MTRHWQKVTDIFNAALEREPAALSAWLDAECGGDRELRVEVESLLAAHWKADAFLDVPAAIASGLVAPGGDEVSLAGRQFGPYRIERELGRGGMGVVYAAEDARLGRRVALKVLSPSCAGDPARRDRLRLEARAAAALSHPAIATVFSLEEIDGQLSIAAEYVRGDTLRAELRKGPLPLDLVLDTGIQVARGLAAAHEAGVIHRDLKPENVVRNPQGEVKILDFGIARLDALAGVGVARLTGEHTVVGTPGYMSPEQLDGTEVDSRTDIFALGVLLFEMTTGRHPSDDAAEAVTVDPRLDKILRRCLQPRRTERYSRAEDVARDLELVQRGRPGRPARSAGGELARPSPLWWWRLHQAATMAIEAALVYGMWRVHDAAPGDWTLGMLLAYIASAAINGTLRTHVWFTSVFNAPGMDDQLRRATPPIRGTDLVLAILLLLSAAAAARTNIVLSSIMAAFGFGWAVTSMVVEPATRRAAFPGTHSPQSPSGD